MNSLKKFTQEIRRRGGEISIDDKNSKMPIGIIEKKRIDGKTLYLIGCTGWRYYSRSEPSRKISIAYICGTDDSGTWARRIPGTIKTVRDAIRWIKPASVISAEKRGVPIIRQGDVYFVPSTRDDFSQLPRGHQVDQFHQARHSTHAPVRIPFLATAYQQKFIPMGRNGSVSGD